MIEWHKHPGQRPEGPQIEHADGGDGFYYRRTSYAGVVSVYRAPRESVTDFHPAEREPRGCWLPIPAGESVPS